MVKSNIYRLFIYGSLKRGHYNHLRFGMDKFPFLGEMELKGYKLVSLGSYPGMVRSDNPNDVVKGELYEVDVSSPEYRQISQVEMNAGYEERVVVDGKEGEGVISFFYILYGGYEVEVPNGEWLP